jgi:cell wall-associated NlpC family hydrolase
MILQTALQRVGASSHGLDCSTFVCRAYAAAGVQIPSTVRDQMRRGAPIATEALSPGDLLFFSFRRRPADHVGIYTGRGTLVHVSSAARCVQVASLGAPPFASAFVGARRLLPSPATP